MNRKKICLILAAVFGALAIFCALCFGIDQYRQYAAQKKFEQLAAQTTLSADENTPLSVFDQIAEKIEEDAEMASQPEEEELPKDPITFLKDLGVPVPEEKKVDFDELRREVNGDIYSWLYIPGTNIDYPILQHPTDNLFYLEHNLDMSRGYPGCIYTENYNSMDWTDPVTLVYGHEMTSAGTMFCQLHNFADPDFFEENQYILVYTPEKLLAYRIFAAEVHSDEHLLYYHDFEDDEQFREFFEEVTDPEGAERNVRSGVKIAAGSRVIALSTCMGKRASNRYLVYGVLLNE